MLRRNLVVTVIAVFFTVTFAASFYIIYTERSLATKTYKQHRLEDLEAKYRLIIASYIKVADTVYTTLINRPEILSLYASLQGASDQKQNAVRKQLYTMLKDEYKKLQATMNLRQLHFHLPDNRSFLRFHRPEKYGDDLTSIRESVRLANSEKRFVQGFEEGRIFNGFRYVYPLFYKKKHIGSVETSISFTAIKNLLNTTFSTYHDFIIKQGVVQNKVFQTKRSNYTGSLYYGGYMGERYNREEHTALETKKIKCLQKSLQQRVAPYFEKMDSFILSQQCKLDGNYYTATFLSIHNLKGRHVAYVVAIDRDDTLYRFETQYRIKLYVLLTIYAVLLAVIGLIYVLKRNKEIQKQVHTDYLTGAYNRLGCQRQLQSHLQSYRETKEAFSILMLDIDHFKDVNDKFGHQVGDVVLKELVQVLSDVTRHSDLVCRWGGEEFMVILPNTLYKDLATVSKNILQKVRNYSFSHIGHMSISIGFSQIKPSDHSTDDLVKRADNALYRSKESGRDQAGGER